MHRLTVTDFRKKMRIFLILSSSEIRMFFTFKKKHRTKKLRKKSNYYFDVEFCQESILGIYKCNG